MAGAPVSDNHLPLVRITWAAVVVLGGLAASFVLWDPLEVDERAHVRRLIAQAAESIKADLEADVQTRLLAQVRLAELEGWEEHPGETLSTLEWTLNCRLFLDHYPSFLNLEWLDAEGRLRWRLNRGAEPVNVPAGAADTGSVASIDLTAGILESGRGPAAHGAPVSVSAAFRLPDGTVVTRVVAPVLRQGVRIGFLSSLWDPRAGVETMLSDHSRLGYVIVVTDGPLEFQDTGHGSARSGWVDARGRGPAPWYRLADSNQAGGRVACRFAVAAAGTGRGARRTARVGSAPLLALREDGAVDIEGACPSTGRTGSPGRAAHGRAQARQRAPRGQVSERLKAEERLRHLSGRLLRLQDEERRRIARELHDGTTQMLGALAIGVGQAVELAREYRNQRLTRLLRANKDSLDHIIADIRSLSHLLHPPVLDELGLEYVCPRYIDGFSKRSGVAVALELQPDLGRLSQEVELALFRITQEALTNIHRHSGSPEARITLGSTPRPPR